MSPGRNPVSSATARQRIAARSENCLNSYYRDVQVTGAKGPYQIFESRIALSGKTERNPGKGVTMSRCYSFAVLAIRNCRGILRCLSILLVPASGLWAQAVAGGQIH